MSISAEASNPTVIVCSQKIVQALDSLLYTVFKGHSDKLE